MAIRDGLGTGEAPMLRRRGRSVRVAVVRIAAGGDQSCDCLNVRPRTGQGRGRNSPGGPSEIAARDDRVVESAVRHRGRPHDRASSRRHLTEVDFRTPPSAGLKYVLRIRSVLRIRTGVPMSSIGKEIRLRRILRGGKTLIVAMDHGVSSGPAAGLEDIRKAVANVAKGGATAVVLHKGVVRFAKDYFDEGLCLVLHLSASTSISTHADRKILVTQVDEAISYGADAISVHVNLGGEDDDRMIEDLGTTAMACDRFAPSSAPTRATCFKNPYDVDVVKHVARVGAELGADIVKTLYTGAPETFKEVVRGCPVPVVVAGGPKLDSDRAALEMVEGALSGGAVGVSMGRNIFQSKDPIGMTRAIARMIFDGVSLDEVYRG